MLPCKLHGEGRENVNIIEILFESRLKTTQLMETASSPTEVNEVAREKQSVQDALFPSTETQLPQGAAFHLIRFKHKAIFFKEIGVDKF